MGGCSCGSLADMGGAHVQRMRFGGGDRVLLLRIGDAFVDALYLIDEAGHARAVDGCGSRA